MEKRSSGTVRVVFEPDRTKGGLPEAFGSEIYAAKPDDGRLIRKVIRRMHRVTEEGMIQ